MSGVGDRPGDTASATVASRGRFAPAGEARVTLVGVVGVVLATAGLSLAVGPAALGAGVVLLVVAALVPTQYAFGVGVFGVLLLPEGAPPAALWLVGVGLVTVLVGGAIDERRPLRSVVAAVGGVVLVGGTAATVVYVVEPTVTVVEATILGAGAMAAVFVATVGWQYLRVTTLAAGEPVSSGADGSTAADSRTDGSTAAEGDDD